MKRRKPRYSAVVTLRDLGEPITVECDDIHHTQHGIVFLCANGHSRFFAADLVLEISTRPS